MLRLLITLFLLVGWTARADVYGFPDKDWHIKLGIQAPQYNIEFSPNNVSADDTNITFLPNLSSLIFVGLNYQSKYGASYGFKSGIAPRDQNQFGDTEYQDWRFNFTFHEFLVGFFYQQYTGFYVENSADIDPSWNGSLPNIQFPDMYLRTTGVHFTWAFSPESFSLLALNDQTERQDTPGGSWLVGANITDTKFRNPGGLIPSTVRNQFGAGALLQEGDFTVIHGKGGYGYTYSKRRWFFGGHFMAGYGLQKRKTQKVGGEVSRGWESSWRVELNLTTGYNGSKIFGGLRANATREFYRGSGVDIGSTIGDTMLFFGVHI